MSKETNNNEKKILAKGIYRYPQAEHFVAARNFIFLRSNGKKYLIIRFINELDAEIDSIKFFLTQKNASGEVISSEVFTRAFPAVKAGSMFSPRKGILLASDCVDFEVTVLETRSEDYIYQIKAKQVCAFYSPKKKSRPKPPVEDSDVLVKSNKVPSAVPMAFFLIIAFALLIGATVLSVFLKQEYDAWIEWRRVEVERRRAEREAEKQAKKDKEKNDKNGKVAFDPDSAEIEYLYDFYFPGFNENE